MGLLGFSRIERGFVWVNLGLVEMNVGLFGLLGFSRNEPGFVWVYLGLVEINVGSIGFTWV